MRKGKYDTGYETGIYPVRSLGTLIYVCHPVNYSHYWEVLVLCTK